MAVTQFSTENLGGNSVERNDIDISTSGQALITKVIAGTNISITSTGVDAGTGDVTISAGTTGLDLNNNTYIRFRNQANTAWLTGMNLGTDNNIHFATGVGTATFDAIYTLINTGSAWIAGLNVGGTVINTSNNSLGFAQVNAGNNSYYSLIKLDNTDTVILGSGGAGIAPVKIPNLAGTGDRMVVADSTGLLKTQAIPSGSGGSSASNRTIYYQDYSSTNTFTLAATPTKIYEVTVNNIYESTNYNVVAYTWTPGTNTITITDTLKLGDKIRFDVELSAVTQTVTSFTRYINTISSDQTAGAATGADYVYYVSGGNTLTLPTAVGNTNRYTIMRTGTSTCYIATTASQLINGQASPLTLTVQYASVDLMSDGTNWYIH